MGKTIVLLPRIKKNRKKTKEEKNEKDIKDAFSFNNWFVDFTFAYACTINVHIKDLFNSKSLNSNTTLSFE